MNRSGKRAKQLQPTIFYWSKPFSGEYVSSLHNRTINSEDKGKNSKVTKFHFTGKKKKLTKFIFISKNLVYFFTRLTQQNNFSFQKTKF